MNNNESEFIDNVRKAIVSGVDPNYPGEFSKVINSPASSTLLDSISNRSVEEQLELIEIFKEIGQPLNIETCVVESLKEAKEVIVELIRSKTPEFSHNKHVILHDHPELAAMQLWDKFNREAVTIHSSFSSDSQLREKTVASFIGITAPQIGVAESATLVEIIQSGQPRSTSLVPSIHVAILKRENIVANLSEAYALLKKRSPLEDVIFISGPSKTADIEAQLVHGAHGPKEVHVIIISQTEHDFQNQIE